MANLSDILNKSYSGYEAPKALPTGTYLCRVDGLPEQKVSKNMKAFLQFRLRITSVYDGVDEDALAEFGPIGDKTMFADFYYETDFGYSRLTSFLAACNVKKGVSIQEAAESANGCQVLVNIKHEPAFQGDGIRAVVGDFAVA